MTLKAIKQILSLTKEKVRHEMIDSADAVEKKTQFAKKNTSIYGLLELNASHFLDFCVYLHVDVAVSKG